MARLNPNKIIPASQVADIINAGGDRLQDVVYLGGKSYIPVIIANRTYGSKLLTNRLAPNLDGAENGTLVSKDGQVIDIIQGSNKPLPTEVQKISRDKITIIDIYDIYNNKRSMR